MTQEKKIALASYKKRKDKVKKFVKTKKKNMWVNP